MTHDLRALLAALSKVSLGDFAQLLGALMSADARSRQEPSTYVSQLNSPLGKRRHLELVRAGKIAGRKVGKLVLVERADLERFLTAPPVDAKAPTPANDADDDEARELRAWGAQKKSAGRK